MRRHIFTRTLLTNASLLFFDAITATPASLQSFDRNHITTLDDVISDITGGAEPITFDHDDFSSVAAALEAEYQQVQGEVAYTYSDDIDDSEDNFSIFENMSDTKLNVDCIDNCTVRGSPGANIIIPIATSLLGILGNAIALCTVHTSRKEHHRTVFFILVGGLVQADLLGIILTTPPVLAVYINGEWVGGDKMCRYHAFTMIIFGMITPFIVCAMAIERYIGIRHGYLYTRMVNSTRARLVLVILWLVTILYSALPFFGFGQFEAQYPGSWCFLNIHSGESVINSVYAVLFSTINLSLILIIICCNIVVQYTLLIMRCQRHRLNSPSQFRRTHRSKKQSELEIQMVILLFAITIVFSMCWAPLMIQIIINQFVKHDSAADHKPDLLAVRLASVNQILDPWVYILCRKITIKIQQFKRKTFVNRFRRCFSSFSKSCGWYFCCTPRRREKGYRFSSVNSSNLFRSRSGKRLKFQPPGLGSTSSIRDYKNIALPAAIAGLQIANGGAELNNLSFNIDASLYGGIDSYFSGGSYQDRRQYYDLDGSTWDSSGTSSFMKGTGGAGGGGAQKYYGSLKGPMTAETELETTKNEGDRIQEDSDEDSDVQEVGKRRRLRREGSETDEAGGSDEIKRDSGICSVEENCPGGEMGERGGGGYQWKRWYPKENRRRTPHVHAQSEKLPRPSKFSSFTRLLRNFYKTRRQLSLPPLRNRPHSTKQEQQDMSRTSIVKAVPCTCSASASGSGVGRPQQRPTLASLESGEDDDEEGQPQKQQVLPGESGGTPGEIVNSKKSSEINSSKEIPASKDAMDVVLSFPAIPEVHVQQKLFGTAASCEVRVQAAVSEREHKLRATPSADDRPTNIETTVVKRRSGRPSTLAVEPSSSWAPIPPPHQPLALNLNQPRSLCDNDNCPGGVEEQKTRVKRPRHGRRHSWPFEGHSKRSGCSATDATFRQQNTISTQTVVTLPSVGGDGGGGGGDRGGGRAGGDCHRKE